METSIKKFIISWKIENFTLCKTEDNACFESSTVLAKNLDLTEWQLKLNFFKNNVTSEISIKVSLVRCFDRSKSEDITVHFCFEIIVNGDGIAFSEYITNVFRRNSTRKTTTNFDFNDIGKLIKFYGEDLLYIRCHLLSNIPGEISHAECILTDKICVDKYSYKMEFKVFDTHGWYWKAFPINKSSRIITSFNISESHLLFGIFQSSDLLNTKISCKLSLLCETIILLTKLCLNYPTDGAIYKHDIVLDKSNLENFDIIKNGKISFLFVFSIPNGTISREVEYPSYSNEGFCAFSPLSDFENQLLEIFRNQIYSDIILLNSQAICRANRCILSARSVFFRDKLIDHKTVEKLKIENANQILGLLLFFLYTDRILNYNAETAIKMLQAAKFYGLPSLKKQCLLLLTKKLACTNVNRIRDLGIDSGCEHLKKAADSFINIITAK